MKQTHIHSFVFIASLSIAVFLSLNAYADDSSAPPDKSPYTLFNPTPDDQLRSFQTDRPTKAESPYTVDAGHYQYEADFVSWTYDHFNASKTTSSSVAIADPTLKAGLTNNTDLEVAFTPLTINHTQDRSSGVTTNASGFGDIYTRVKFNLIGNEGGDYVLAIVPYIKAPTAPSSIGNQHWEGGAYMPFSVSLPRDWTMSISSEIDILENAAMDGTHPNFSNLIDFSHPLFTDSVTGYVEFWSDVNNDVGAQTQYTGDLALSWAISENMQLDGGINIGLNKAADDWQPYLGISQRF
jgi:Putative MetA-pathway of phenol degradation